MTERPQVGGHMLAKPDYKQILIWADALKLSPADVIMRLIDGSRDYPYQGERPEVNYSDPRPTFEKGRLNAVYWSLDLLPLEKFEWVAGLEIGCLVVFCQDSEETRKANCDLGDLPLSRLAALTCSMIGLTSLDLSRLPELVYLECYGNQLTELDVSRTPKLRELHCNFNRLGVLDIEPLENLEELWFDYDRTYLVQRDDQPDFTSQVRECMEIAREELEQKEKQRQTQPSPSLQKAGTAGTHPKILLVSHDPAMLETYRELLSVLPSHPQIRTAASGPLGLTMLETGPFHLLITALRMPKMDGLEVISIVRRIYPQLRTMLLSGDRGTEFRDRAYALGADLYLNYPCSEEEMKRFSDSVESLLTYMS